MSTNRRGVRVHARARAFVCSFEIAIYINSEVFSGVCEGAHIGVEVLNDGSDVY